MNSLVTHLFKKDVRHLRGILLVWVLLIASQAILVGSGISASADDMATMVTFQVLSSVLPLLKIIAALVLIPLLIHGEPLTGTTAFWLSRPLSRKTILAAKGLFIGLLLILFPLLVEVGIFAGNGVQVRHILLAIPEILIGDMALILQVMVLAVLTRNFARFAIAGVVIFIGMILLSVSLHIARLYFGGMDSLMRAAEPGLAASRGLVAHVSVLLFGLAVVLNQYLTRKTVRSICLAAVGFALQFTCSQLWSINFFAEEKAAPDASLVRCEELMLSLDAGHKSSSDEFQMRRTGVPRKEFSMRIEAEGLDDKYVVRPTETIARLEYPDGVVLTSTNRMNNRSDLQDQDMRALASLFADYQVLNRSLYASQSTKILTAPTEQYFKVGRTEGNLSLEVEVEISGYRVAAEIPLQEGARYSSGSEHLVVSRIMKQSSGCTVILRESKVNLLFGGREARSCSGSGCSPLNDDAQVLYALRNKALKQIYLPRTDRQIGSFGMGGKQRLSVTPLHLVFEPNRIEDAGFIVDEVWLQEADLVRIEEVRVGYCRKTIEVEGFQLESSSSRSHRYVEKTRDGPDPEILAAIVLPENPTREDITNYVKEILVDAECQRRCSSEDPQVDMLAAVGPEHVDVLLMDGYQYYAYLAVKRLAGPVHKELIIAKLPGYHQLIDVVVGQGWTDEVGDTLVAELKKNPENLPTAWIKAVAEMKDPETYDYLKRYLIRGNARSATYEAIKDLPGIDLQNAVDQAWRRVRYDAHDYQKRNMVSVAIQYGHLDALHVAAEMMGEKDQDRYRVRVIQRVLPDLLPEGVSVEDFPAWYRGNRDYIRFDETTRRYDAVDSGVSEGEAL